ncbi:hypothetical protein EYW49_03525 [Siculibacillus lacustris]|uniref:Uncharacterized protein n=1 Tax=Siculibacillus lacustris TaxID=1549641 RepID=A0A4Q9VWU0_9HYPH|nr:hypothetical protein [Siculibacillus lacustris]TBW40809.1 hypothetical protein EYW49_03525 [Siculibacillus lacustris]
MNVRTVGVPAIDVNELEAENADIVPAPERKVSAELQKVVDARGMPHGYVTIARRGVEGNARNGKGKRYYHDEPRDSRFSLPHWVARGMPRSHLPRMPIGKRRFVDNSGNRITLEQRDGNGNYKTVGEYDMPTLWDLHRFPVWGLDDVFNLLKTREDAAFTGTPAIRRESALLHGDIVGAVHGDIIGADEGFCLNAQRRSVDDKHSLPTIRDAPNTVFALDVEHIDPGFYLVEYKDSAFDPQNRAEIVRLTRAILPEWLRTAAFVVQLSASHGFGAGNDAVRLRVFFVTSKPLTLPELKNVIADRLIESGNPDPWRVFDAALFKSAQPIYINTFIESPTTEGRTLNTARVVMTDDPFAPRLFRAMGTPYAVVPEDLKADRTNPVRSKDGKRHVAKGSTPSPRVRTKDDREALAVMVADPFHGSLLVAAGALIRNKPNRPLANVEALLLARLDVIKRENDAALERARRAKSEGRLVKDNPRRDGRFQGDCATEKREIASVVQSIGRHYEDARAPSAGSLAAYRPGVPALTIAEASAVTQGVIDRVIAVAKGIKVQKLVVRRAERQVKRHHLGAVLRHTVAFEKLQAMVKELTVEVVSVSTGVGKSYLMLLALQALKGSGLRVALWVPDHDLAQAHEAKLRGYGVRVMRYQGLERMCLLKTEHDDNSALEFVGAKGEATAACRGCSLAGDCKYNGQRLLARQSEVVILCGPGLIFGSSPVMMRRAGFNQVFGDPLNGSDMAIHEDDDGAKADTWGAIGDQIDDDEWDAAFAYYEANGIDLGERLSLTSGAFDLIIADEANPAKWVDGNLLDVKTLDDFATLSTGTAEGDGGRRGYWLERVKRVAATMSAKLKASPEGWAFDFVRERGALAACRGMCTGAYWRPSAAEAKVVCNTDEAVNGAARKRIREKLKFNQKLDRLMDLSFIHPSAGFELEVEATTEDEERKLRYFSRSRMHQHWRNTPMLILDATAHEVALRKFFPRLAFTEARARDGWGTWRVFVSQGPGLRTLGASTMAVGEVGESRCRFRGVRYPDGTKLPLRDRTKDGERGKVPDVGPRAVNLLNYLSAGTRNGAFFDAERPMKIGIVAPKVAESAFAELKRANLSTLHFGKQRGRNDLEGVDRLLVFGQSTPQIREMILTAEALFGERVDRTEDDNDMWRKHMREVFVKVGTDAQGYPVAGTTLAEVSGFDDPALQVAYDLLVTCELIQADGRGRSVRGDTFDWIDIVHCLRSPLPGVVYTNVEWSALEHFEPTTATGEAVAVIAAGDDRSGLAAWARALGYDAPEVEAAIGRWREQSIAGGTFAEMLKRAHARHGEDVMASGCL